MTDYERINNGRARFSSRHAAHVHTRAHASAIQRLVTHDESTVPGGQSVYIEASDLRGEPVDQ